MTVLQVPVVIFLKLSSLSLLETHWWVYMFSLSKKAISIDVVSKYVFTGLLHQ